MLLGLISSAHAAVIFDSGLATFTPVGTQFGRIFRDGVPSDWASPKTFPGVSGAPTARAYQTISFNSGQYSFLQILFDDPGAVLFDAAYRNSFNPVNIGPNYGLNVNYLGDPGNSQPFGVPTFFQIVVTPNSNIVLSINELNLGGGTGARFNVLVEGFYDVNYSEVPEPSTLALLGSGVLLIAIRRSHFRKVKTSLLCAAMAAALSIPLTAQTSDEISPEALQQIRTLLAEKESRSPAQTKLGSQILYAMKAAGPQARSLQPAIPGTDGTLDVAAQGVLVDVRGAVSDALTAAVVQAGGRVIDSSPASGSVRARIPLSAIEAIAARPDVSFIKPAARARTNGGPGAQWHKPTFASLARVHKPRRTEAPVNIFSRLGLGFFIGSLATQGDITHAANTVRSTYGANGGGVRVGVLSDSAEAMSFLIGTGDLGPGTTLVQEYADGPGSSEGTAMMEIVQDLVPGAQIFFASAFNGPTSFANNIRALRNVYRCDVIVDDVSYSDEPPFQDGEIARAVNDVTASGALYFSSAGNNGSITKGNSSTWEGDFVSSGGNALLPGYRLHDFLPGQSFNRLLASQPILDLFWSDPLGRSANDYDLFVLNPAGTQVLFAATDTQNGTQDPVEEIYVEAGLPANCRIVIAAKTSAATRALRLDNLFGVPFSVATTGATHGHNGGPATISVAAVNWASARLGTRPFVGGARNPTEVFSSDGPRRMFYTANGTPITPGNLLFSTGGGTTFLKPDIAAADGVTTRTPGFNPFFGTSAAAPHAAAIAALIKSARPSLTAAQIYNAMTSTALDIQAVGLDRDSGFGLVMAPQAVAAALQ